MASESSSSYEYLRAIAGNRHSIGTAGIEVLNRTGRKIEIQGIENIPREGPLIVAANHFVRAHGEKMTGPNKMNDILASVGVITRSVRESRGEGTNVVWTPSAVPRPEARFPSKTSPREVLRWLSKDAPFVLSNVSRSVFLRFMDQATDILPVPFGFRMLRGFLQEAQRRLNEGDVFAIFPEGEVSTELRQAQTGFAHFSLETGANLLPIAQYDRDDTLVVQIGTIIQTHAESNSSNRSARNELTIQVMTSIARMLPENLRGFYRNISSVPTPVVPS